MRLSDAISFGRTVVEPDTERGWSFATCALGMGMAAMGVPLQQRSPSKAIELWPWLKPETMRLLEATCPLNLVSSHYFSVTEGGETLDQLIDWVRSVEPAEPTEAQAEQDAKEVLQPAELSDLNAKLGQTLDQLHAHLVEATCDQSYLDSRNDTWREE